MDTLQRWRGGVVGQAAKNQPRTRQKLQACEFAPLSTYHESKAGYLPPDAALGRTACIVANIRRICSTKKVSKVEHEQAVRQRIMAKLQGFWIRPVFS